MRCPHPALGPPSPRERGEGRKAAPIKRTSWPPPRHAPDRAAEQRVQEDERARGAQHQLQLARHRLEAADGLVEIHDLDDADIVVGADDGGEHADDGERIEAGIDGGEEDVPLAEEAGEPGNAGQREHQDRQDRRHHRIGRGDAGDVVDVLDIALLAAHGQDEGEGAERHRQVDKHVDDDAAHAGFRVGGKADQREAHVADRRIGHQPLEVALADRGEGAQHHRGDRDEDDDLLPVGGDRLERAHGDAHDQRHGRHLGRSGEEGGHRRRRAFVDVRSPHVERHGRDLEDEAGEHEDEAEHQPELPLRPRQRGGDGLEAGVAGVAVDQADAVEQDARRQRAEHEIFEARFRRAHGIAIDGGDDVERQRLQLEPEIERQHVVGRDHQEHAERRQHDQHRVLELVELLLAGEADRHHQRQHRAEEGEQLHQPRERIGDEGAGESLAVADEHQHPGAGADQQRDREAGDRGVGALAREDADHQERQRADGEDQLRGGEDQARGKVCRHGAGLIRSPWRPGWPRWRA